MLLEVESESLLLLDVLWDLEFESLTVELIVFVELVELPLEELFELDWLALLLDPVELFVPEELELEFTEELLVPFEVELEVPEEEPFEPTLLLEPTVEVPLELLFPFELEFPFEFEFELLLELPLLLELELVFD